MEDLPALGMCSPRVIVFAPSLTPRSLDSSLLSSMAASMLLMSGMMDMALSRWTEWKPMSYSRRTDYFCRMGFALNLFRDALMANGVKQLYIR